MNISTRLAYLDHNLIWVGKGKNEYKQPQMVSQWFLNLLSNEAVAAELAAKACFNSRFKKCKLVWGTRGQKQETV